jgi:hypothetical protein
VKKFIQDSESSVLVEFALVAPLFIILLCITLESARVQVARLLLQRAIYDLAYRLKVDNNRGSDFEGLAKKVIELRRNNFFLVEEVKVEAFSSKTLNEILAPVDGVGGPSDIVLLRFTANFGLFNNLVDNPKKIKEVFEYYYINEPLV